MEYLLSRGAEKVEVWCICLDDLDDGDMIAIDSPAGSHGRLGVLYMVLYGFEAYEVLCIHE